MSASRRPTHLFATPDGQRLLDDVRRFLHSLSWTASAPYMWAEYIRTLLGLEGDGPPPMADVDGKPRLCTLVASIGASYDVATLVYADLVADADGLWVAAYAPVQVAARFKRMARTLARSLGKVVNRDDLSEAEAIAWFCEQAGTILPDVPAYRWAVAQGLARAYIDSLSSVLGVTSRGVIDAADAIWNAATLHMRWVARTPPGGAP